MITIASRRADIVMSTGEITAFIDCQKTVMVATIGRDGRPHLAPLWFFREGTAIVGWTFARSQKAVNLRRDPRATLGFEDGEIYAELRGVNLECDVELVTAPDAVLAIGITVARRYSPRPGRTRDSAAPEALREQAPKRVGLVFHPIRTTSWDHRKLGDLH